MGQSKERVRMGRSLGQDVSVVSLETDGQRPSPTAPAARGLDERCWAKKCDSGCWAGDGANMLLSKCATLGNRWAS